MARTVRTHLYAFVALLVAACGSATPAAQVRRPATADHLTLIFGGDVLLERPRRGDLPPSRPGGEAPLALLAPWLSRADLALVNLEEPLCRALPEELAGDAPVRLAAPPERASALAAAGVDVVSLANNHALDCGAGGLAETVEALAGVGVRAAGVALGGDDPWEPVLLELGGHRVAVVAATLVPPRLREPGRAGWPLAVLSPNAAASTLARAVREARDRHAADLVVVSLHWGCEGCRRPRPEQTTLAEVLVAAGADVVVGHGPHVVQRTEGRSGRLVAYSLGNLLFDASGPPEREGALLEVTWSFEGTGPRLVAATWHRVAQETQGAPPTWLGERPLP